MSIQFLVQTTGVRAQLTDAICEAIQTADFPMIPIGHIPFENVITGLENARTGIPTIAFGSTKMTEMIQERPEFSPGVFYQRSWFDPREWKSNSLLNQDRKVVTAGELREKWVSEPTFVKSITPKVLTGMVLEPVPEDHKNWLEEQSLITNSAQLIISPVRSIEREWRFFIVGGQVITGSLYRRHGCLVRNEPISQDTWEAAQTLSEDWLPFPTIVMDICQLYSGEYLIVEYNCLNCSGVYKSDFAQVIRKLNEIYGL